MPKAGPQPDAALAWLSGIDLPGMEIEYAGLPVDLVHALETPAGHAVRQQPEVAATARRKIAVEKPHGSQRQLQQAAASFRIKRKTRRLGHAVVIVPDRIDARAVAIARFAQACERPLVFAADGEAGSPVALYLDASDVLQQLLGLLDIARELLAVLIGRPLMGVTMARQFVALIDDPPHQAGIAFRYPAQHEIRRVGVVLLEQRQYRIHVALDAARQPVPGVPGNMRSKSRDMEIVLHVYSQRVADSRCVARPAVLGGDRRFMRMRNFAGAHWRLVLGCVGLRYQPFARALEPVAQERRDS